MKRIALLSLTAAFVVGCQDTPAPTDVDVGEPSFEILDGTNAATGNPDFWWLPPNVPKIKAKDEDNYDADEFDRNFEPIVRICGGAAANDVAITGGTTCVDLEIEFPFNSTPGAGVVSLKDGTESYSVDWETDGVSVGGEGAVDHHILVVLEDFFDTPLLLGFADVDVVPEGKDKKGAADEAFVVVSGRTLPIKFRLEANLRCQQVDGPCAATVVNLPDGGDLFIDLDENGFDDSGVRFNGGDAGTVSATAVPCAADIPVDIPVFGNCFTIDVIGLTVPLVNPATVFQCSALSVSALAASFVLSVEQLHLLRWHRFDAGDIPANDEVVALPLTDDPCLEIQLSSNLDSNPLMRFARAVRDRFNALVGPRPLFAESRVWFWDERSGGDAEDFSDFQLALPSKMEIDAGDGQDALAGTAVAVAPAVKVTDAHGGQVVGATVTFTDDANGTVVPTVVTTTLPDSGIAAVTSWTVNGVGVTELTASCFGCAVVGNDGPQPIFDPFTPVPTTASPVGPLPDEPDSVDVGGGVLEPSPAVLLETGELVFTAEGFEFVIEQSPVIGVVPLVGAPPKDIVAFYSYGTSPPPHQLQFEHRAGTVEYQHPLSLR